jgi:predicted sulfurtransferase
MKIRNRVGALADHRTIEAPVENRPPGPHFVFDTPIEMGHDGRHRDNRAGRTEMRCHNCRRKITDENPSSTVDKWGNACCDTCTTCEHGVPLIKPVCRGCDILVRDLLAASV